MFLGVPLDRVLPGGGLPRKLTPPMSDRVVTPARSVAPALAPRRPPPAACEPTLPGTTGRAGRCPRRAPPRPTGQGAWQGVIDPAGRGRGCTFRGGWGRARRSRVGFRGQSGRVACGRGEQADRVGPRARAGRVGRCSPPPEQGVEHRKASAWPAFAAPGGLRTATLPRDRGTHYEGPGSILRALRPGDGHDSAMCKGVFLLGAAPSIEHYLGDYGWTGLLRARGYLYACLVVA